MRFNHSALAVCAVLIACGGGSETTTPGTTNTIANVTVSSPANSVEVGQSVQMTATAHDAQGNLVNISDVAWAATPATVASIDTKGLLTALAAGTVNVSANVRGVTGSLAVPVVDAGIPTLASVFMPGNSFSPFNVTVKVNGTVRFEFPSAPHNVIFSRITGAPADIQVTSNTSVSRAFTVTGTFPYDCTLHPGMSGQVTVVR